MTLILPDNRLYAKKGETHDFSAEVAEGRLKEKDGNYCLFLYVHSCSARIIEDKETKKSATLPGIVRLALDKENPVDEFLIDYLSEYKEGFKGKLRYNNGDLTIDCVKRGKENPAFLELATGNLFPEIDAYSGETHFKESDYEFPKPPGKNYKTPEQRATEKMALLLKFPAADVDKATERWGLTKAEVLSIVLS
jgi:hypothetical protein